MIPGLWIENLQMDILIASRNCLYLIVSFLTNFHCFVQDFVFFLQFLILFLFKV